MKDYIANITKEAIPASMTWNEIANQIILPKMAGLKNTRCCIHDDYMNFVADCAPILGYTFGQNLASIMFEIALQRLSCGAVLHDEDPISWPAPLPAKYWEYSSCYDEPHDMTEGCYKFIMQGIGECINFDMTRNHAFAILFGIMSNLQPDGSTCNSWKPGFVNGLKAIALYQIAEGMVERFANFCEIYHHYAKPEQWQKHKIWFARNADKINWKKFFEDTQAASQGNFIQRYKKRRQIKKEILNT